MPSKAKAIASSDHNEIRQWAEDRGATPACVRGTGGKGDIGMLRLDFPGYTGAESLEPITWDEWFEEFDERGLALLHQETTAQGQKSNFNKLISRETAEAAHTKAHKAGTRGIAAMPKATARPSSTEKSAAQAKAQSRNARRSAEGKTAQKHHPITNVDRKQEAAKPSPHARRGPSRAA